MNMRIALAASVSVLCLVLPLAGAAPGETIANFTDGNNDVDKVDAYHGVAGGGWRTAWRENTLVSGGGAITDSTQVVDANPIDGGGNYLHCQVTTTGVGTSACYATGRSFSDGVDVTKIFHIDFTIRIDENMDGGTTFDGYHDRYTMCDGDSVATSTHSNCSWEIFAHGAAGAQAHAGAVKQWAFYDGDNNGSFNGADPTKMLSTGIALTTGGVYDFSVTVDPVSKTWSGSVSDGTNTWSHSNMGWRTSGSLTTHIYFESKAGPGSDTRIWSVDSISIVNVPEPCSAVLLAIGVATLAMRRVRRW